MNGDQGTGGPEHHQPWKKRLPMHSPRTEMATSCWSQKAKTCVLADMVRTKDSWLILAFYAYI